MDTLAYVGATVTEHATFDTLPARTVYVRDGHEQKVYRRVLDGPGSVWREAGTTAKLRAEHLPLGGQIVFLPVGQTNGQVFTDALATIIASELTSYSAVTDGRHDAAALNADPAARGTFEDLNAETAADIATTIAGRLPAVMQAAAAALTTEGAA